MLLTIISILPLYNFLSSDIGICTCKIVIIINITYSSHSKILNSILYDHFNIHRICSGFPTVVQWKRIQLGTVRLQVRSLASLSGLRIRYCHELWCRSQTRLGSGVAMVVVYASSCSSD